MNNKFFAPLLVAVLAFTLQTTYASSLIYSATLTPVPAGSSPSPGANVLFSGTSTFSALDFSGTLFSTVLNNDSSNPYGLANLTFTYLIQMDPTTVDPVSRFTISSFANFLTDVSETTSNPGDIVPSSVNRSIAPGNVVRFSFDTMLLGAGTTSALLVIQTDAQNWTTTSAGLVDGVGTQADSVAPTPVVSVPEPSQIMLGALSLFGLLIFRRCNKGQSQTDAITGK
ncbi:MAG: PEP-CTERM sorting domain-containing protein [Verrucomicrobiales bacterium]|nr:PEP-CTERM sorting domain-containing protein [Verrucomicrobiales bacterium]